jgi:peptidoglycan/LPS O-acetylase OafA/YrhL
MARGSREVREAASAAGRLALGECDAQPIRASARNGVVKVRYNPALDGMRAIAIAFVLAAHAYRPAMPGGWIGVDVFFVLSGYLITSILLNELRRTDRISLGNFYMRRFLRLTPPLVVSPFSSLYDPLSVKMARPNVLIAPGALLVLVAFGLFAERSVFAFLIAPLAASLATGALIVCLQGPSPIARVLSLGPIRYTGKISYGLYLYHWPIFILGESVKIPTPFHLYAVALIGLIFAVAALSFEFIEKPFLKLKDRFNWRAEKSSVVPSARVV